MRRPQMHPYAGSLALDEETVERLLTGALAPAQAPPGYGRVADLLAAAVAAPSPGELAGQGAVFAELRAVARPRRAAPRATRAARTSWRRRRTRLAVVVVAGALVSGGVAGAATGHLPGAVREAARTILDTVGGGVPPTSAQPGQPPTPATRAAGAGPDGSRPDPTGPGPGLAGAGSANAAPNLEGLCQAFTTGNGGEQGERLDAPSFQALARAAGGQDKVAAFCTELRPGGQKPKEPKPAEPSSSGGQGQGGPPASAGEPGQGSPPRTTGR